MQVRRSFTLVELLVVVVILTTLVAAVIPVMAPAVEQRRIREAARGVSTFISGARARAVGSGRSVGVFIAPLDSPDVAVGDYSGASMALYYVRVPLPYGGDTSDATLQMKFTPSATNPSNGLFTCTAQLAPGTFSPGQIGVGDHLRVNHQGHRYRITSISGSTLTVQVFLKGGVLPWTASLSEPMPYVVHRQPSTASGPGAGDPYQLPEGTVVDLYGSVEGTQLIPGALAPVVIMFSPNGSVEQVYDNQLNARYPAGPIFLLVGKREKALAGVPDSSDLEYDEKWNIFDITNLWVTVSHITGQVVTAEVAPQSVPLPTATSDPTLTMSAIISNATRFARDRRGTGGF